VGENNDIPSESKHRLERRGRRGTSHTHIYTKNAKVVNIHDAITSVTKTMGVVGVEMEIELYWGRWRIVESSVDTTSKTASAHRMFSAAVVVQRRHALLVDTASIATDSIVVVRIVVSGSNRWVVASAVVVAEVV
jgi:hypothetical protein